MNKPYYEVLQEMLGEEQAAMMLDRVNGPDKHLGRIMALIKAMNALAKIEGEKL